MLSAYLSSFSRCRTAAALPQIQKLHAQIVEDSHEETPALQNALLLAYTRCAALDEASMAFSQIHHHHHQEKEIAWAHLIKAYARRKQPETAAQIFHQMCAEGDPPGRLSFIGILACYAAEPCSEPSLHKIQQIHARLHAVGLHRDVVIATNLVTAYARNHSSDPAPDSSIAYTSHSSNPAPDSSIAYTNHSSNPPPHTSIAAAHHHHHAQGFVGSRIYVDGRARSLDHAQRAFDQVHEPDTVLWTALIAASMQSGRGDRGLHLLQQMSMEAAMPNEFTYASVLVAASHIIAPGVRSLRSVHASVAGSPHASDAVVCNGLIHMYARCQMFDAAVRVFDDLGDRRNATSWNGLMQMACSRNEDRPERALACLREMQERGVWPDESTFVGALDMLSNYGLFIDKGKRVHTRLLHHPTGPDMGASKLGNALLNMYARCGPADAARLVFDGLVHRDVITWTTMIACYAQHGAAEAALELALQMQQAHGIAPNSITFVNLLSVCSHSGLLGEACRCFALMMLLETVPSLEHYNCIIDSLARLGLLDEGEALLENMPIAANSTLWTTLLGGCRLHLDLERGERTAACILQLGTDEAGPHVWLWNVR